MSERLGRKVTILAASVVFTVGAAVMGASSSKEVLMVGRATVGAGIGLASMTVPIYIAESAPTRFRGTLVVCNIVFTTFGQFVAGCVCGAFSGLRPHGWKYMLGLAGVPSAIQFVGFAFMPESPRWLASRGRYDQARSVLVKIRGSDQDVEDELRDIRTSIEAEETSDNSSAVVRMLKTPSARRALLLACLLQMFQQIAGINTVMYYSAKIITMTGVSDPTTAIWMSAGVASINFLCTFIGLYLVERAGRRKLVLFSLLGTVLALLVLGVGFQVADMDTPKVNLHNDSLCGHFEDCSSCTYSTKCGFCYKLDAEDLEASCVQISADSGEFAASGRCAKSVITEAFHFAPDDCPSDYAWVVIVGLCLYLFCFASGMGSMPWTINSEIFPTWARGTGQSLATSTNWMFNLVVSMTFLSLTEVITKQVVLFEVASFAGRTFEWDISLGFLDWSRDDPLFSGSRSSTYLSKLGYFEVLAKVVKRRDRQMSRPANVATDGRWFNPLFYDLSLL